MSVLAAGVEDASGGRWSADNAPRLAEITLQLSPPGFALGERLVWVRGEPDPELLEDLADPPLRSATEQRLLPFKIIPSPGGARVVATVALEPGEQSALVLWAGSALDAGSPWWTLPLRTSAQPAAGARLVASVPADGASGVPAATRKALLQWDGYVHGWSDSAARLDGPKGSQKLDLSPFDCREEGLPEGSCSWLDLASPLAAGEHSLTLTGALRASTGQPLPLPSIRFSVASAGSELAPWSPTCAPDERALPFGCGRAARQGFWLRTATSHAALLSLQQGDRLRSVIGTGDVVALFLPTGQEGPAHWIARDLTGAPVTQPFELWLAPDLPRVQVREVLANPLGTEGAREYVEVVNRGDEPISLEGWQLSRDAQKAGGRVRRSPVLPAGASGLIVGSAFDARHFENLPSGLTRHPLDRSLSLGNQTAGRLLLRDARGRRVADVTLPPATEGRCMRVDEHGDVRGGTCRYREVPPP